MRTQWMWSTRSTRQWSSSHAQTHAANVSGTERLGWTLLCQWVSSQQQLAARLACQIAQHALRCQRALLGSVCTQQGAHSVGVSLTDVVTKNWPRCC